MIRRSDARIIELAWGRRSQAIRIALFNLLRHFPRVKGAPSAISDPVAFEVASQNKRVHVFDVSGPNSATAARPFRRTVWGLLYLRLPFLPHLTQPAVYLYLLLCRLGLRPSEYGIVRSGPLVVRSSEARNSLPQRGLW